MMTNNIFQDITSASQGYHEEKRKYAIASGARRCYILIKKELKLNGEKLTLRHITSELVERVFKRFLEYKSPPIYSPYITEVKLTLLQDLFGNQEALLTNNIRVRYMPYWNPSKHKINLKPLQIIKSISEDLTVTFLDTVEPGEYLGVPYYMTVGDSTSVIRTTAPQLQAIPVQEDTELDTDLAPLSYSEWCTFISHDWYSTCCERSPGWHMTKHALVCTKCGTTASSRNLQ